MPRFYFDVIAGGELYPDGDGLDLDSLTEAREHARRLMARILWDAPVAWDWRRWAVTVAACDGTALVRIPFPASTELEEAGGAADADGWPQKADLPVLAACVAVQKPAVL